MKPNETHLEKLLIKSILVDKSFLPMMNERFRPEIFVDKSFEEVSRFCKDFFNRKGRIATIQDIKLLANNDNLAGHIRETFNSIKGVDVHEIPKEELLISKIQ